VWRFLLPATWQFSIRELLLLTAAVAAFLAWAGLYFRQAQPYRQTPIPQRAGDFNLVGKVCLSLGEPVDSYSAGGSGSSDLETSTYCYDRRLRFPPARRGELMEGYQKEVRSLLDTHADEVWGAGTTRDGQGLRGFEFTYEMGRSRGRVFVRASDGREEVELFIFVHEFDVRR
jgi:hypothetical protein